MLKAVNFILSILSREALLFLASRYSQTLNFPELVIINTALKFCRGCIIALLCKQCLHIHTK
jgi:hypothetical protein